MSALALFSARLQNLSLDCDFPFEEVKPTRLSSAARLVTALKRSSHQPTDRSNGLFSQYELLLMAAGLETKRNERRRKLRAALPFPRCKNIATPFTTKHTHTHTAEQEEEEEEERTLLVDELETSPSLTLRLVSGLAGLLGFLGVGANAKCGSRFPLSWNPLQKGNLWDHHSAHAFSTRRLLPPFLLQIFIS